MRLLNTVSLELSRLYVWREVPDYAIFSHRWNTEEVTYADLHNASSPQSQSRIQNKNGFAKIHGACKQALKDGYTWIWIDSCCIDKSSSSELQEAINSMWRYYAKSNICYAYLADVPDAKAGWGLAFARSKWFTRGWTLQELIAPTSLEFFAENWDAIGTKFQRNKEIAEITSIEPRVLLNLDPTAAFSTAERLSWASHRSVTREEDESYSQMGLFNVNMPLLYGEGREQAFARLQEAIFKAMNDHSIFLYRHSHHKDAHPLLASSPTNFCDSANCSACPPLRAGQDFRWRKVVISERWQTQAHEQVVTTINMFRSETSTVLPLLPYTVVAKALEYFDREMARARATHVAVLNFTSVQYPQGAFCLLLRKEAGLEACSRLQVLPAILPCLGDLEPQLQKTKLLICPGPSTLQNEPRSEAVFSFSSKSFHVDKWKTKGSSSHSVPPVRPGGHSELVIKIDKPKKPKNLPEVSCCIAASQGLAPLLTIQLSRDHEIWFIREIFERKKDGTRRRARSLFRSPAAADYCEIQWPGGKKHSVKLRRLSGSDRSLIASRRYQISLDS